MRALVSRYGEYRDYWTIGLFSLGEIVRRIADVLIGRPAVAPVPIPVRNQPHHR